MQSIPPLFEDLHKRCHEFKPHAFDCDASHGTLNGRQPLLVSALLGSIPGSVHTHRVSTLSFMHRTSRAAFRLGRVHNDVSSIEKKLLTWQASQLMSTISYRIPNLIHPVEGKRWRLPTNRPRACRNDGESHALEQICRTLLLGRWCLVRLRTLPSAKPDAQELLHTGKFSFRFEVLWSIPRCIVLLGRSGQKVSLASFVSGLSCVCAALCVPKSILCWGWKLVLLNAALRRKQPSKSTSDGCGIDGNRNPSRVPAHYSASKLMCGGCPACSLLT